MARLRANLTSNGRLAAPGGSPVYLSAQRCDTLEAFIPRSALSVTATVSAEQAADVHMAIYTAPTTSGGDDGALISRVDLSGLRSTAQTLTVSLPQADTSKIVAPAEYVLRIWIDNVTPPTTVVDSSTSTTRLQVYGINISSVTVD